MGQLHQSTERNGQRCGPPETTQKGSLSGEEVHAVSTPANVCDRSDVSQDPDFLSSRSVKHHSQGVSQLPSSAAVVAAD